MTGGSGQHMRHMRCIGHWMLACLVAVAGGAWTQPEVKASIQRLRLV